MKTFPTGYEPSIPPQRALIRRIPAWRAHEKLIAVVPRRSRSDWFSRLKAHADPDADAVSTTMIAIEVTIKLTAFIFADIIDFLFHLFAEPLGVLDQLL
jgi:hypothetical protein